MNTTEIILLILSIIIGLIDISFIISIAIFWTNTTKAQQENSKRISDIEKRTNTIEFLFTNLANNITNLTYYQVDEKTQQLLEKVLATTKIIEKEMNK